jgi:hypothetical protein
MFRHANGGAWKASEQGRPMAAVNEHARLKPPITFHGLRHTWASLAAMNGVPLLIVAKNLGQADTRMVEKHYGHLARISHTTDGCAACKRIWIAFGAGRGKSVALEGAIFS